jgi:hypothetical protein
MVSSIQSAALIQYPVNQNPVSSSPVQQPPEEPSDTVQLSMAARQAICGVSQSDSDGS